MNTRINTITVCLASCELFRSAVSIITPYLTLLFQRFTLSSVNAIEGEIANFEPTHLGLYTENIRSLSTKPALIRSWATSVLSWVLRAIRPLRIEELSVASAINTSHFNIYDLQIALSMSFEEDVKGHLSGFIALDQKYARILSHETKKLLLSENIDDNGSSEEHPKYIPHIETDEDLVRLSLHYIRMIIKSDLRDSTESCMSGHSRTHDHEDTDPILGFMDYSCRFWHVHFLRITNPSSTLKQEVMNFFKMTKIASKWFGLYLTYNGLKSYLIENDEIMTVAAERNDEISAMPTILEYSPAQLARYFGFTSLLPLLSDFNDETKTKTVHIRHGRLEYDTVLLHDEAIQHFTSSVVATKDQILKPTLGTQRENLGVFLLHRIASLGLLEAFKIAYRSQDDLLKRDKDGRTPLHMAAICGSLDIITFIIHEAKQNLVADILNILDSHCETPLIIAVRLGHSKAAQMLAKSGAKVDTQDITGKTAIHHAVLNCPQILQALVAAGENALRISDNDGHTALHLAATYGSIQSVSVILDTVSKAQSPDSILFMTNQDKKTPLHYAAESGHDEVVDYLIQQSKCHTSQIVETAKMLAVTHGHLSTLKIIIMRTNSKAGSKLLAKASATGQLLIVQYLLKLGVSANPGKDDEEIPICAAAASGYAEIVRTLLKHKADANSKDDNRQTPLHHAAINGMHEVAEILLSSGAYTSGIAERANVNAVDTSRCTPLHLAARCGNVRMMELLIKYKPDLSARSRLGQTALHLAVQYPEAVKILLEKGAKVDVMDISNQSPLHIAAKNKNVESVQILIDGNADTKAADNEGKQPLYYAIENKDMQTVRAITSQQRNYSKKGEIDLLLYFQSAVQKSNLEMLKFLDDIFPNSAKLLKDPGNQTLLHLAAGVKSSEVISYLISLGLSVNQCDDSGRTALHMAVDSGFDENTKILLESDGIDIDKTDVNGETALHIAAELKGSVQAVSLLLDANASIDKKGYNSETPLFKASYSGNLDIVKELLSRGASPEIGNDSGWTPLHAAVDNVEICRLLLSYNATINIQQRDLWTPLHLAVNWEKLEVVSLLLEKGADPNLVNKDGRAPFHMYRSEDMLEIFLKHQGQNCVDWEKPNNSGMTLLSLTILKGESRAAELIIKKGAIVGFKELRMATEADSKDMWKVLHSVPQLSTQTKTDADGWFIDHFLYQSEPRIVFDNWVADVIKLPTNEPNGMIIPDLWQSPDTEVTDRVNLAPDTLQTIFLFNRKYILRQ